MQGDSVMGPECFRRRVSQEHRETGTEDLVDTAGLTGWPAPPDITTGATRPHPWLHKTPDCCLRCRSERLKSPPLEVIDGQFLPMANALSPGGLGEGGGSRRNLTCPLVPGKVLRSAPFSEPPVSGAAMLVRRNHRYGDCPNPRVAARRPPAPTPQPPAANTD